MYSEFQNRMPIFSKQLECRRLKSMNDIYANRVAKKFPTTVQLRIQRSFDIIKCPHFSYEFKNDIESAARWIFQAFVTRPLHSMLQVYSILFNVFYTTPILMRFPPHKFAFNYSYLKDFKNKITVKLYSVESKVTDFLILKMYFFSFACCIFLSSVRYFLIFHVTVFCYFSFFSNDFLYTFLVK